MSSRAKQIVFHILVYVIPVSFLFGMAAGKERETSAYERLLDRLPDTCQERLGRVEPIVTRMPPKLGGAIT